MSDPKRLAKKVMVFPPKKSIDLYDYFLLSGRKGLRSGPFRFPQSVGPYGTKLYVMTPETLTGWPERSVGLNRAPRAAETAAGLSSGCPLTALAEMTLPVSLINT